MRTSKTVEILLNTIKDLENEITHTTYTQEQARLWTMKAQVALVLATYIQSSVCQPIKVNEQVSA